MKRKASGRELLDVLRQGLRKILSWSPTAGHAGASSLNVIWTDGVELVASRVGRTLWYTIRSGVFDCEICGFPHAHHTQNVEYRAVVIASEPITHGEEWIEVPERTVLHLGQDSVLELQPL